jgi:hypothetical protein
MLTIIYAEAFTRGLKGTAQGPGFDGCFARERDGNMRKSARPATAIIIVP